MSLETRRVTGFTLIELMIAMVLSLLVVLGLIALMTSVGRTNRVQDGMARLQENGRYALQRIAEDVRAAANQYCSNFAVATSTLAAGGIHYMDRQRPISAHFNTRTTTVGTPARPFAFGPATPAGAVTGPVVFDATQPYLINSRFMLFGSECDAGTCTPTVNAADRATDPVVAALAMGTAAGQRARGADVLTLWYVRGNGTPITAQRFENADAIPVELDADVAELGIAGVTPMYVTDCATAALVNMVAASATTLRATSNLGAPQSDILTTLDLNNDPRVFNAERDFLRVSYFLRVKDVGGRRITSLVRSENGDAQELVEGVERLDFLYGVNNAAGATTYLTAAQVDAMPVNQCPPSPAIPFGFNAEYFHAFGAPGEPGCGWRAVNSVEVYMLVNTVNDVTVQGDDEFRYTWLNDGSPNAAGTFENPVALGTLRNGLPPGRMLRREFRMLISLRGVNF